MTANKASIIPYLHAVNAIGQVERSKSAYFCSQSCDCYYARHGYVFVKANYTIVFITLITILAFSSANLASIG